MGHIIRTLKHELSTAEEKLINAEIVFSDWSILSVALFIWAAFKLSYMSYSGIEISIDKAGTYGGLFIVLLLCVWVSATIVWDLEKELKNSNHG